VLLDALRAQRTAIVELYEERELAKALREIMLLADRVNEYVDKHKPWELAKHAAQDAVLHDVCTVCIEAFRVLTIYLKPVMPALAAQVEAFLRVEPMVFADAARALGAHTIGEYKHLMQRVDPKVLDALFEAPAPAAAPAPGGEAIAAEIGIDEGRSAHRTDRRMQEGRRLDEAAAAHARRGRGSHAQCLQRHRVGVQPRAARRQAHGAGREPRAAQDEVRPQRGHGARRVARQ
jgi:hypothetical protein